MHIKCANTISNSTKKNCCIPINTDVYIHWTFKLKKNNFSRKERLKLLLQISYSDCEAESD